MFRYLFNTAIIVCSALVAFTMIHYVEKDISLLLGSQAALTPFIDNLLCILLGSYGLIGIATFLSQYAGASSRQTFLIKIAPLAGTAICFAIVSLGYISYEQYAEINQPRKLLLFAWFIPLATAYLLTLIIATSAAKIWAAQGILLILYIIVLDVSYRTDLNQNPMARTEQHAYHWNIRRKSEQNFNHSPLPYLDEIQNLENYLPVDSRFFSDMYTSYYIKSVLPYYAVNVKYHHRNHYRYSLSNNMVSLLCKPDINGNDYGLFMEQLSKLDTQFIIINHDRNNSWLGTDCIFKNQRKLEHFLREQDYTIIFEDKTLSAFKL